MDEKERIILVEDDRDLRETLIEYLHLAGYTALGVGSGLEFYRALAGGEYSMAILDLGLPDQDGFILAEYLRKNTSMGVIILSARDAIEDRVHGYAAGADLYFSKPVDCRELTAAIDSLVQRQRNRIIRNRTPVTRSWRLDQEGWTLTAPNGGVIPLTSKEMQFMVLLAAGTGQPVPRESI